MNKLTTDDEVLALAEKIKKQRVVDTVYAQAYNQVCRINSNYIDSVYKVEIACHTKSNHLGNNMYRVELPCEMAHDLMQFVQDYIAEDATQFLQDYIAEDVKED